MIRASAIACLLTAACTTRYLPPPTVPERLLPPALDTKGDPPSGETTVAIDATAEPARVDEITSAMAMTAYNAYGAATAIGVTTRTVCPATPCTAYLSPGHHDLVLSRVADDSWAGTGQVDVAERPVAYRYALGHAHVHAWRRYLGAMLFGLGASTAIGGGIWWGAANETDPALAAIGDAQPHSFPTGAAVMTATGVIGAVAGIVLLATSRAEVQNGAGTQWTIGPAPLKGDATASR